MSGGYLTMNTDRGVTVLSSFYMYSHNLLFSVLNNLVPSANIVTSPPVFFRSLFRDM